MARVQKLGWCERKRGRFRPTLNSGPLTSLNSTTRLVGSALSQWCMLFSWSCTWSKPNCPFFSVQMPSSFILRSTHCVRVLAFYCSCSFVCEIHSISLYSSSHLTRTHAQYLNKYLNVPSFTKVKSSRGPSTFLCLRHLYNNFFPFLFLLFFILFFTLHSMRCSQRNAQRARKWFSSIALTDAFTM